MRSTTSIIGIESEELPWLRLLVNLLRHPDPTVPELTRQALLYITRSREPPAEPVPGKRGQAL